MIHFLRNKYFKKLLVLSVLMFPLLANALQVLGYIYRSDSISHLTDGIISRQNKSINNNIRRIDIITPQAYQINKAGTMWGTVDPSILALTKNHPVKIMPLVTNTKFDRNETKSFLNSQQAQQKAIHEMVQVCKQNNLAGLQIDFEHIPQADKNAFTHFYQQAAAALHANHFLISVTIVPRITNAVPTSNRKRSGVEYWKGAYDYAALGRASDFVTLMAYDQHGGGTTPGSACEPSWLKQIIVYALKYIPASKISIGLPVHSSYWYTVLNLKAKALQVRETDLTYSQAKYVLKENHATVIWDKKTNVPFAMFNVNNLNHFLFLQNAATFKTQLALIKKYKLLGVSLWCLGYEDPNIWKALPVKK
jgi:spore germination protein YaaH